MQMAGIAGEEHAPVAIAVGDQPVRDPFVVAQQLDRQIDARSPGG